MAYALFNSGAAAAYANSFRQRNPYGGFDKVKSNVGVDTFSKIPFLNFQAELELAKAGMEEAGATKRQQMVNDASIKINEMRFGESGDKSTAKKAALARMLAGSGSTARRGGGVASSPYLSAIAQGGRPIDSAVSFTNKNNQLDTDVYNRATDIRNAAIGGIKSVGTVHSAPVTGGGQVTVKPSAGTQLQPTKSPSLKSGVTEEDLMKQVFSDWQKGGESK